MSISKSRSGVTQPPEDPVELPDKYSHGGPTAYNKFRCRCAECQQWRRSYDRDRMEVYRRTQAYKRRGSSK